MDRVGSMCSFEEGLVDGPGPAILSLPHVVKDLANILAEVAMVPEVLRKCCQ